MTRGVGGPLSIEEIEDPLKRSGEVLVDVRLALVTEADVEAHHRGAADSFPRIQGGGGAGVLASGGGSLIVGTKVIIWPRLSCKRCAACGETANDRCDTPMLVGLDRPGTLAASIAVPRANVVHAPSALGPAHAAAAVDYADAWRLLREGDVRKGVRVVVVGSTDVARRTVELAEALQAVVVIARSRADLMTGQLFDLIVAVGVDPGDLASYLATSGRLIVTAPVAELPMTVDAADLAAGNRRIVGSGPAGRQDLVEVLKWFADSGFTPDLGAAVSMEDAHLVFDQAVSPRPSVVIVE